jgi:choline dehydrogenase-like flavoprotein
MAINSQPRDGRGSCQQIGFCFQGCKSGAKWSTLIAEIPKGEATGQLEIRPESHVLRIEHDATGKVTSVIYADSAGTLQKQKARVVCIAGNSIESPRLLLNSASPSFPDGLANSSGQVGRNYMQHTTGSVYGVFDKPVRMYRGTTMAGIVRDDSVNNHPEGLSAAMNSKRSPSDCRFLLPSLTRAAGVGSSPVPSIITRTSPACGSSAKTCHKRPTV